MTPATRSPSVEFVDGVGRSIQGALDDLFRHENELAESLPPPRNAEPDWTNSLAKLETTIGEWQAILDAMGEKVRLEQEGLAILDADLHRALGAFAAARKYLQGQSTQADGEAKA